MTDATVLSGPTPAGYRRPFAPLEFVQRLRWKYFPPKSGMEMWAEKELARLLGDPDGDDLQRIMNKHLLKMIRQFGREGHSGGSAGYAIWALGKLLSWEPLTPLTGEDSEWNDISDMSGGPMWQNNRCGRVFKGADGRAYDIDGKVFREPSGVSFTNFDSRVYVTFPYTPATKIIDVGDDGKPPKAAKRKG